MIVALEPDQIISRQLLAAADSIEASLRVFFDPRNLIESIDTTLPDVLIIEPQTAPLSGIALLQEFRSYEDLATIPIIVYSIVPEHNFKLTSSEWRLLGVEKYFYKPSASMTQVIKTAAGFIKQK
jgi:chemotaxis response regulator CheB